LGTQKRYLINLDRKTKRIFFKANKKDTWEKKELPTNSMKSCFDDLDMFIA